MDRDRLTKIEQSDLTESRVNEEFIAWLRWPGPIYLCAVMLGITAFLYMDNRNASVDARLTEAWVGYLSAELPDSYTDVVQNFDDIDEIDALEPLCYLRAAEQYMATVQTRRPLGQTLQTDLNSTDPVVYLTDAERAENLTKARDLFNQALAITGENEEQRVLTIAAYAGLAAVAEAQGDAAAARTNYEAAIAASGDWYAAKADQLQVRLDTLEESLAAVAPVSEDVRDRIVQRNNIERDKSPRRLPIGALTLAVFPPDEEDDDEPQSGRPQ